MRKDYFQKIQSNTCKIVAQNPVILRGSEEDRRNEISPIKGIETYSHIILQMYIFCRNEISPIKGIETIYINF